MNRKMKIVLQDEISDCGLACISMICNYFSIDKSMYSLKRQYAVGTEGISFYELENILLNNGISSCSYQLEMENLPELSLPAILQWRNSHFVVLTKVTDKYIEIYDPAFGKKIYTKDMASGIFSGYAIEVYEPPVDIVKKALDEPTNKSLFNLALSVKDIKRLCLFLFATLFVVQLFTLLTPKLLSLVVDEVVEKQNIEIFYLIAGFFALMYIVDLINKIISNELQQSIAIGVNKELTVKCINTLINQSVTYIERRSDQELIKRISLSLNYGVFLIENYIKLAIYSLFAFVFFIGLAYLDLPIALIVLLSSVVLLGLRFIYLNRVNSLQTNIIEQDIAINRVVSEYCSVFISLFK